MRYVVYYRVSTDKQDLTRQESIVSRFLRPEDTVVATYREVQSASKRKHREALHEAITHAKLSGSVLLITDLSRLSRNVHELTGLMEAGVEFVAADNPTANRTTIHILVALAEDESRRTSQRVKDGMRAHRENGSAQGAASPAWQEAMAERKETILNGLKKATKASVLARQERAASRAKNLSAVLSTLKAQGLSTLAELAEGLNSRGYVTSRGNAYTAQSVHRLLNYKG